MGEAEIIKRWIKHWELWREGILAVTIILIIYKLIENIYPIWQEIHQFIHVIRPFIMGSIIAYLLNVPCNKIQARLERNRNKRARGLSVFLVYLLVICLIVIIFSYVLPMIIINIFEFTTQVPSYISYFAENLDDGSLIIAFLLDTVSEVVLNLNSMKEILNQVSHGISSIGEYAKIMTTGIMNIFLSVIISIYVLLYKDQILAITERIFHIFFNKRYIGKMKIFINKSNDIFYKFVACQFIDACMIGVLATLILSLLGVEYAITLGIILGTSNMIPYFGSIFASILTVLITIFTGGPTLALIAGVCLLVLQQIDGNIIGPRLMGEALDLNPILIIFSITIGGAYFGIAGMFLSVPLAAIIKIVLMYGIDLRERQS